MKACQPGEYESASFALSYSSSFYHPERVWMPLSKGASRPARDPYGDLFQITVFCNSSQIFHP